MVTMLKVMDLAWLVVQLMRIARLVLITLSVLSVRLDILLIIISAITVWNIVTIVIVNQFASNVNLGTSGIKMLQLLNAPTAPSVSPIA